MQPSRVPVGAMMEQLTAALSGGRYPFWFPEKARGQAIEYFVFGTDFQPLALSATQTSPINIVGDSAFIILSAVLVETSTDNLTFLPNRPLLVNMWEGGSGRALSNTPIHVNNWFGTAEEPKYWDVPRILAPNSTFNVQLQNLEAVARNVRVAFHGFKVYGFKPGN